MMHLVDLKCSAVRRREIVPLALTPSSQGFLLPYMHASSRFGRVKIRIRSCDECSVCRLAKGRGATISSSFSNLSRVSGLISFSGRRYDGDIPIGSAYGSLAAGHFHML